MTWTYSDEYYKNYTRDTWNESAPEYAPLRANLDKYNDALLAKAAPRAGERVLDVACGDGEPALTLARSGARVTAIDLSERMVDLARGRAKKDELDVDVQVMDAEKLTLPDASFDLVTCRFGLQIVTDPEAAIAEMLRVLKPGGRVAMTVWGPGERCPGIHAFIGPMLEFAEPDETGYLPTPYEMGGEGELRAILQAAGFVDATDERVTRTWTFPSVEAAIHATLKGTPIGHSLSEEEPDVQKVVMQKARANLERLTLPDGSVAAPCEAVVVGARKA